MMGLLGGCGGWFRLVCPPCNFMDQVELEWHLVVK